MEVLQIIHEAQKSTPQYLFFDGCTVVPILDGDKIAFLSSEQHHDDEIPSWKLDHMYAKKREPGTEQPKPVKRRSKKKEVLTSQFLIHAIEDPPPKINIIRQRHSINTGYVYSRPKILSSPYSSSNKFYNSCSSTNSLFSHTTTKTTSNINSSSGYSSIQNHHHHHQPPHHPHNQRKVTKEEQTLSTTLGLLDCPSPGAQVTVCNGVELDNNNLSGSSSHNNNNNSVSSRSHYQPKTIKKNTFSSMSFPTPHLQQQLPVNIENRSSSLDSIGEDDDPTSLFFDFAMEEEEEGAVTLDVDFNEIQPMHSSATKDETVSLNFFHQDCNDNSHLSTNENNRCNSHGVTDDDHELTDSSLLDNFMTPLLSSWDSSPIHHHGSNSSSFNSSDNSVDINNLSLSSTNMTTTTTIESEITPEVVKRKRGRPFKNKPSTLDYSQSSLVINSNNDTNSDETTKKSPKEKSNESPIRRSSRPVKTKNFFDEIEDLSPKRRKGGLASNGR